MQKIILAYNFVPERLQALKLACMMLKVQLKVVAQEDFLQPVGFLAGLENVISVDEKYTGSEVNQEMLLLCNLNRPDIDRLLSAIKKGKLQQVNLKAVLTPFNAEWSGVKLYQEISQEHEYMHNKKVVKPQHFSSTEV